MWKVASALVLLLSVAAYRFHSTYLLIASCSADPKVVLEQDGRELSWDACEIFSLEYDEARHKFRSAARSLGAELHEIPITGDGSHPLTTDVAILPGSLPGTVVHATGTHGVEGYAGSAIQLAILQDGVLPPPSERPTLVLVHAVNPYGMKNYRRFNEHNVDLNRNCIADFPQFLKDRDPNVAKYDDFRDLISPPRAPTEWDTTLGFWAQVIQPLFRVGYNSLKRVMVSGQYHHQQGIFFGGTRLQPSIEKLVELLNSGEKPILKAEPLVFIDIHTGLGKHSKDTLMSATRTPLSKLRSWFPTAESIITPVVEDKKAMDGYDLTQGFVATFIEEMAPDTSLCMVQEFGTVPGILVGRSLVLENMMHHHGDNKELGRRWMQLAFYPQSTLWRSSVVQRGVSLIFQSIDYTKGRQ